MRTNENNPLSRGRQLLRALIKNSERMSEEELSRKWEMYFECSKIRINCFTNWKVHMKFGFYQCITMR
jgi:hypothetical protein